MKNHEERAGTRAAVAAQQDEKAPGFDFTPIRDDFHKLLIAVGNKLEREWPARYAQVGSAQMELLQLVRLAIVNYKTIAFVCSDIKDGAVRDPRLCLSTPALSRTILEIIGSVLYLLEDLPRHTDLFFRAAWRDEQEMLTKYRDRYGGRPRWDAHIEQRAKGAAKLEASLGISDEDKKDINRILRWPKLGKIVNRLRTDYPQSKALPYLQFLNDWLYRELSTQSHLEPKGLGEMGLHFVGMRDLQAISGEDPDKIRERLDHKLTEFRTDQVWIAITLILSLATEIDLHFNYGLKGKLVFFWSLFSAHSETSEEFYEERYRALLA